MPFKLSALQLVSAREPLNNLIVIKKLLADLSPEVGQLVLLPENALSLTDEKGYLKLAETLGSGYWQEQLAGLAKQYSCYLICGSFPIQSEQHNKIYTTSLVFSPLGELVQHYHKMHLFDALVSDEQGIYKESDTFIPGNEVRVFQWQQGQVSYKVGLAICYDLRFPTLFQHLRELGADIILLPAAFTKVTGEAHWLPLLQARAIENQCYIVAANQGGVHDRGETTYGHSMILSPWGEIVDECDINEGFVDAHFDKQKLDEIRSKMPVITHNRFKRVIN